ncbi:MAG: deoxyribose-phosphate aldolase [Anaerolineales bacterium]|nr:deoxyribose-phosphate aldolase [Anaerolineales bacterium]
MEPIEIARLIDHTLLKPEAVPSQIERLCKEAREYNFATVCVNPVYVERAAALLAESQVGVCGVIAFPLGATTTAIKVAEARQVLADGAREVDMVLHVGALKAGDHARVQDDIAAVAAACHVGGALLKVILETALLNDEEKIAACRLAVAAGADFVKTSTGFSSAGATIEDVQLMRRIVGPKVGVKAAGGIRTYADALAMIQAGANRIGASASVTIIEQARAAT